MAYRGNTDAIRCDQGGFNHNPNVDLIPAEMMVTPTRNINLHENGRGKRGGTVKENGTAISGGPQGMGLHDFTLNNGNQFIVKATDDGKVYKNFTDTIKIGLTSGQYYHFDEMENELYISNGLDSPMVWDGIAAGTSALTNEAADWSDGSNEPMQMIKHGKLASERMWAILPDSVYASKNADGKEFVSEVVKIVVSVPGGIVGAVEFGDRLICFGKRDAFIIDDTSIDTANWGYQHAQWSGGVAHWRLLVKTPTDLIAMTEDGEIYSVITAQEFGDYKSASLTSASFVSRWIRENVNLSAIAKFHAVYDSVLRAIKFFVVRTGQSTVDTALVYFIDRGISNGWMIHSNQEAVSGYSASASAEILQSAGNFEINTMDYSGFQWRLEQTNKNDDSAAYPSLFRTPRLAFGDPRSDKNYLQGWLITQAEGTHSLSIKTWVDGRPKATQTVDLTPTGDVFGTGVFNTAVFGEDSMIDKPFPIHDYGKRIQYEIFNNNANEDFFISQILTDFRPIGKKAEVT